ncbi:MAG: amidohydrolase family protein [Anaerolineaceae bacterium]
MQTVDRILHNGILITFNKTYKIFEPGAIAIQGSFIVAVGEDQEILGNYEAQETVDCQRNVIMPGLINTHTHVPMTLLRGLANDLRLDVWLMGYMMPVEREFVTPEFVRLGTKIGCAEMIRSGITTFADMYYFEDTIAETTAQIGMRALTGQSVMKFPTPDSGSYEDSLQLSEALIQKWKGHPLIIPSIAPHAIYSCSAEILSAVAELAIREDVPVQFHVAETSGEVETARDQYGMPVIPFAKKTGLLDSKLIAAHCVWVDEGEIRSMKNNNTGIAHNPSSNMKLASGFAPIKRMLDLGCMVGIGTDGPASNNDLDFFEEMRLASFLSKVHTGDPTSLPARQVLEMGTIMGARALHIDHLTGSLEPGKRADLIVVDIKPVHNLPRFKSDPDGIYAQVLYASKASDVLDVMVDGHWLMEDRSLLTIDEASLVDESQALAERIDEFLKRREESVFSKLIAIGGAAEEESFEVQAKMKVDSLELIEASLFEAPLQIIRKRHYHEYDTYFKFSDPTQGRLRYREDEFIGEDGNVTNVRSRLTLIGEAADSNHIGDSQAMLSRSRYFAPASHSLRFYNEYFKPDGATEIEKNRVRYLVKFEGTEFFVNLDTVTKPKLGKFIEVKSRTWSRQDAENKTQSMRRLIEILGLTNQELMLDDYIHLAESKE